MKQKPFLKESSKKQSSKAVSENIIKRCVKDKIVKK